MTDIVGQSQSTAVFKWKKSVLLPSKKYTVRIRRKIEVAVTEAIKKVKVSRNDEGEVYITLIIVFRHSNLRRGNQGRGASSESPKFWWCAERIAGMFMVLESSTTGCSIERRRKG